MSARRLPLALSLLALTSLLEVGCRPDPGTPTYSSLDDFTQIETVEEEPLPGPDPYVEGVPRLSFGSFYEGGASQVIAVDDQVVHYYIFLDGEALTYSQSTTDDRVEGLVADRLTHAGGAWWGGGIMADTTFDLSAWTTLHISLKSSATEFESTRVGMQSDSEADVLATDYGFVVDGEWHHLAIPLLDLVDGGLNLAQVDGLLVLTGGASESGTSILVDGFYLTQE